MFDESHRGVFDEGATQAGPSTPTTDRPAILPLVKVPILHNQVLDLDAPVLPAYRVNLKGSDRFAVWCKYCRAWHFHGPADGHREAHCSEVTSQYRRTGYNLALRGKASRTQLRRMQDERR